MLTGLKIDYFHRYSFVVLESWIMMNSYFLFENVRIKNLTEDCCYRLKRDLLAAWSLLKSSGLNSMLELNKSLIQMIEYLESAALYY